MKVDVSVLNALSGSTIDGNSLRLSGQLDRKAYQAVAKVIEAAGGKWNRKAGAHTFDEPAADAIDQIILTGEVVAKKQELQQFFTPPALADHLVNLADVRDGHKCLEPSAGKGAILAALRKIVGPEVFAWEIDPRLYAHLREFHWPATYPSLGDFLKVKAEPIFDRVVMNPPFTEQADVRHVLHAAKFLRPGGRLASIMSASVMFRDNQQTEDFRRFVKDRDGTMEDLPPDSFKASGTLVRTAIVEFFA